MKHKASTSYWENFDKLPDDIQNLARKNFVLLKSNPSHPSLHLKKVNDYYSIRIGLKFRALGIQTDDDLVWFWIGTHADYDKIIK